MVHPVIYTPIALQIFYTDSCWNSPATCENFTPRWGSYKENDHRQLKTAMTSRMNKLLVYVSTFLWT